MRISMQILSYLLRENSPNGVWGCEGTHTFKTEPNLMLWDIVPNCSAKGLHSHG